MNSVDKAPVRDLVILTDASRRFREAAVVTAARATQRGPPAVVSHREEALISALRQAMARLTLGNSSASNQARQLDEYVGLLLGKDPGNGSSENAMSAHQARKCTPAAQTRPPQSAGQAT